MRKKILFIINPISGMRKLKKKNLPSSIESYLDQSQYDYSISYTQYSGHATKISQEAVENGYDTIVAVGGDGSVNEIARPLIGTDVNLAILPFGSGNGLSRHLGIPLNVREALNVINQGKTKRIDTAEYAPDHYFFSNVGIGFAANVAKRFDNHIVRGFFSYVFAIIREFFHYNVMRVKLKIDDQVIEREVISFNVFNANQFGYGVGFDYSSELDDGILNVCVFNKFPRLLFPVYALYALLKRTHKASHLEIYTAREFEVLNEKKENWLLQVDGECHHFDENWKVKVHPLTLNVIIP